MSANIQTFEDVPDGAPRGVGIPWYASVCVVVVLGAGASVVDWALGDGPHLATGAGFLLGCLVLGGRTRPDQLVAAFVGAPPCFAVIVAVSAAVQLFDEAAFGSAFGVFWTYALVDGAPWLFGGTLASCLLATLRLIRRRR